MYNGLHTLTAEISTSRDLRGWQFQKLWISQNLTTWFEDSHGEIFHMKLFKQNAYLFSPKLRYIQLPSFSVLIAELPICNCNTDWKERENEFCWTSFWSQVVKINSAKIFDRENFCPWSILLTSHMYIYKRYTYRYTSALMLDTMISSWLVIFAISQFVVFY